MRRRQLEADLGNDIPSRRNIKCNVPEAGNKLDVSEGQKGGQGG